MISNSHHSYGNPLTSELMIRPLWSWKPLQLVWEAEITVTFRTYDVVCVCVCVCVCLQCDFSLIFLVSYERTLSYLDKHVLLARAFIQRHCSVKRLNSLHLIVVINFHYRWTWVCISTWRLQRLYLCYNAPRRFVVQIVFIGVSNVANNHRRCPVMATH